MVINVKFSFNRNLNEPIIPGACLRDYTTFGLGGPCRTLFNCETPEKLTAVVTRLIREATSFILIGGGSNLVVSDDGVECAVVRYVTATPLIVREGDDLIVSGSTALDDLATAAVGESLQGINYCSGIPGTVGGAIVGNAGAFGKQVGDVLKSVTVLTRAGERKVLDAAACGFSYRHSHLKETGDIVLEARFALTPGNCAELARERAEFLVTRHKKHPDLRSEPCAGSFFRNIEPTSSAGKRQAAGWYLEEAGGKDLRVGGAYIFPKHANIIVRGNNCSAQNVHDLHLQMKKIVKEKFDLALVREVRFVGNIKGKPADNHEVIW